jgi:hypothetical protein
VCVCVCVCVSPFFVKKMKNDFWFKRIVVKYIKEVGQVAQSV